MKGNETIIKTRKEMTDIFFFPKTLQKYAGEQTLDNAISSTIMKPVIYFPGQ